MRSLLGLIVAMLLANCLYANDAEKPWGIHGQVVDEHGKPVEDFEASTFWLANGNWWDEKGELLEEAKGGKLWTNEGVLASRLQDRVERRPEGKFKLNVDGDPRVSIFAVDRRHERGGVVVVDQSAAGKLITIPLAPLVRVTAKVYCSEANANPGWSIATVYVPDEKGNLTRLMHCGSFRGRGSFLLPPGRYEFDVYSESPSAVLPTPKEKDKSGGRRQRYLRVEIPPGKSALDLGTIDIVLPRDKDGIPHDLTQYYGKAPPELAVTDARGVPKSVKLSDFRGKWILLDFWKVGCGPCVYESLPELVKFYEEHAADRDRFEILAICNTDSNDAHTIEKYDALVAPLVEKVWGGKQLPYPVLIDGEGKTCGIFGITSYPTALLIDPEGHLVKDGDENILAEKLTRQP
jgi:thiol-disulfide isomerase/thioredoxin